VALKKMAAISGHWLNFKYLDLLLAFAVALVALLAFSRYFGIQLMEFDAVDKILFHSKTEAAEIIRIFSQPDGHAIYAFCYRPFSSLVWWFIFLFNGLNFSAFHLFNFVLHAVNSVLVFAFARKLFKGESVFFSFVSAVVFALHPVNLNVVLFVSRMPELLVGFFLLCSLLSLNAFFEGKGKRFYLFSIFLCFAGVFSKESGALIPFVLFFYCFVFLPGKKLSLLLRGSLKLCAPFFSLIALYAALMVFSLGRFAGYIVPFSQTGSQVIFSFFRFLFYPIDFLNANFFSEFSSSLGQPLINPLFLISFAVFALLVLRFFSKEKLDKPVLFAFCWLFIFLFAFIAFGFVFEWYMYVPLVPFCLLLSAFLSRHAKKFRRSNLSKLFSLLIALLLLSFVSFSPLVVHYGQPLAASKISQSVLSQTRQVANELPSNSTLYLLNYPFSISSTESGFKYGSILINEATVQAFLEFVLPEKKFNVISLSSSDILSSEISENQFTFNSEGNLAFLIENTGPKAAKLYVSREWEQKKDKEIIVKAQENTTVQTIEVTVPEKGPENAFFLFFNGRQVQLFKAGNHGQ
jgi:hypothetical protein